MNKKIFIPILILLVFFFFYTNYFEITGVVKGEGRVVSSQKSQKISHLEGGIIEEIYVKENQLVKKGDKLIKIKNVNFQTDINTVKKEMEINKLKIKRLTKLVKKGDLKYTYEEEKDYIDIISSQKKIYKKLKEKEEKIKEKYKLQKEQNIAKIRKNQIEIANKRIEEKIINEKYLIVDKLYKDGTIMENEYLDELLLKKQIETTMEKLQNEKKILESEEINTKKEEEKELSQIKIEYLLELNKLKIINQTLKERLSTLKERYERQLVVSPLEGYVNQIKKNTVSSTVKQGEEIMEITPKIKEIIIECEIKEKDRSKIWVGQKAKIEIAAYNYSNYGFIEGEIISISPDSFVKKGTKEVIYLVQIKSNKTHIKKEPIMIGMLSNINIITKPKKIIDLILNPIKNISKTAFTEK